jgi:hypothetical protein
MPEHQIEWDKDHPWQLEIEQTLLENLWFNERGVAEFAGRMKLDSVLYRFWKDGKPIQDVDTVRRLWDLAEEGK